VTGSIVMHGRQCCERGTFDGGPKVGSRYRGLQGFKGVTFFIDEQEGAYGSLTLWELSEDADAAGTVAGPALQEGLVGVGLQGQPQIRTVEIYEPRG
jgi:hypothetical protein